MYIIFYSLQAYCVINLSLFYIIYLRDVIDRSLELTLLTDWVLTSLEELIEIYDSLDSFNDISLSPDANWSAPASLFLLSDNDFNCDNSA